MNGTAASVVARVGTFFSLHPLLYLLLLVASSFTRLLLLSLPPRAISMVHTLDDSRIYADTLIHIHEFKYTHAHGKSIRMAAMISDAVWFVSDKVYVCAVCAV